MSWKAIPNGTETDLVGKCGDTIDLDIQSTDPVFTWTGWTWTGQVRATPDSTTTLGTFTIVDSSTTHELSLEAVVSSTTTASWTPGDTLVYGIKGTKAGYSDTFVSGRVVPQPGVVR